MVWIWADHAGNLDSFDESGMGWRILFFLFIVGMNSYPAASIFIMVAWLGDWKWITDQSDGRSSAAFLGLLVGAISNLLFSFVAGILLDTARPIRLA